MSHLIRSRSSLQDETKTATAPLTLFQTTSWKSVLQTFIPDYLMEVSSPDFDVKCAKECFNLEDTNGDGFVSREELVDIATKVGMPMKEAKRTVSVYCMSADRNCDNTLSLEEYQPLPLVK